MYLLVRGDARRLPIADGSVHCVVTSPPYFALRDYQTGRWVGGDSGCDHQQVQPQNRLGRETPGGRGGSFPTTERGYKDICGKCGARRVDAQLGLEPTPDDFVAAMAGVFREVWRVLHPSGTVWLNMGDSYAGGKPKDYNSNGWGDPGWKNTQSRDATTIGLKPKDLCMIPARLALALQADGWYLRSEIIWCKPNPMPESVTDRPTKSHEQVYLLSKQERYYFDAEAVREPAPNNKNTHMKSGRNFTGDPREKRVADLIGSGEPPLVRNLRSVWTIATESFPGAHFATFPRKLVEPCIRAGTSERGCCPRCGAPWAREVATTYEKPRGESVIGAAKGLDKSNGWSGYPVLNKRVSTLGWRPSCSHGLDPVPCTVLDPFAGSGTTLVVAEALGRRGIGVELSAEYLAIARRRLEHPHAAVPRPGRVEHHPLFGDAP
jgi:DNA modification methylase